MRQKIQKNGFILFFINLFYSLLKEMNSKMAQRLALLLIILCNLSWGRGMTGMKFALETFSLIQIMAARAF